MKNIEDHQAYITIKTDDYVNQRLICFPYAGGVPSVFRNWSQNLPKGVEVIAVRLPGRERLIKQPAFHCWKELMSYLITTLMPLLDLPFSLFGHSFGARVAYELALKLEQENFNASHVFISGCQAPDKPCQPPFLFNMSQEEFHKILIEMGGLSCEIVQNRRLMKLLEPTIRADMKLAELWPVDLQKSISSSTVILYAIYDSLASPSTIYSWKYFSKSRAEFHKFYDGHFFIHSQEKKVTEIIGGYLCGGLKNEARFIN